MNVMINKNRNRKMITPSIGEGVVYKHKPLCSSLLILRQKRFPAPLRIQHVQKRLSVPPRGTQMFPPSLCLCLCSLRPSPSSSPLPPLWCFLATVPRGELVIGFGFVCWKERGDVAEKRVTVAEGTTSHQRLCPAAMPRPPPKHSGKWQ